MTYHVRTLPRAERDFRAILDYVCQRSPQGASSLRSAFEQGLERLRTNPNVCGLAPEDDLSRHEVRQLFFKTPSGRRYRMVFFVDGDVVFILRVRGPGQPPLTSDELQPA